MCSTKLRPLPFVSGKEEDFSTDLMVLPVERRYSALRVFNVNLITDFGLPLYEVSIRPMSPK